MNSLIQSVVLCFAFTYVVCNLNEIKEQISCMKNSSSALNGLSDQQLYDLTQENLVIGEEMVLKRADTANATGLPCYYQFYQKYTKGLEGIFMNEQETKRLDAAKTPKERSGALKGIAGITQAMRCDEAWRAVHFNETIEQAKCSMLESATAIDLLSFKPKLAAMKSGLCFGSLAEKFSNNVMSGVIGEISKLYGQLYAEAEKCSMSISNPADKCHNIKMFDKEIQRIFDLVGLQVLAAF